MDDLQQMIPEVRKITVGGVDLEIGPIKMRQLSPVTRHMRNLVGHFQGSDVDIMGMLTEGADDLTAALSAATDRPAEWVGELTLDDVIVLARTVIEVNADFFARTILPLVEKATDELTRLNLRGRTSSSSS